MPELALAMPGDFLPIIYLLTFLKKKPDPNGNAKIEKNLCFKNIIQAIYFVFLLTVVNNLVPNRLIHRPQYINHNFQQGKFTAHNSPYKIH